MTSVPSLVLTFLFNALWQAPLLFAAAWAGALLLRRAPAAYRHRLWVAALALTLLAPLVGALRPSKRDVSALALRASRAGLPAATQATSPDATPSAAPADAGHRALRAIAWAYLLLTLGLALRLRRGWSASGRVAREAQPAPAALEGLAAELGAPGMLRVSGAVAAPMTFGVRRPVVVLPEAFARQAAPEALRGVLVHELAHVRRRDCAVNLLCELLALPLAFHPTVRLLRRRIAGAREAACDEAAVAAVGPRPYAATLLGVAAAAAHRPRLAGALGVLDGNDLEDRMRRVLDTRARLGRGQALVLLAGAVVALGFVGRAAAASALQVSGEPGPMDMVGVWKGAMATGERAGEPAAGLEIILTPDGPAIDLVLFRYKAGSKDAEVERPAIVSHRVEKGVLHFRTRAQIALKPGAAAETFEADWTFRVVGTDAGELLVTIPKLAAERAAGRDVPPPAPPLAMKRTGR